MRVGVLAGVVALAAAIVVVPVAVGEQAGEQAAPQAIYPGGATYPRVIHTADGRVMASVGSMDGDDSIGVILESTDDGATFQHVGTIRDPEGAQLRGMCCGTLFELPTSIGDMPAGTLLWATTAGYNLPAAERHTKQRLWESRDHGRTWTFKSDIATNPTRFNAWEPELSVSKDGHLVAHWADETDKPNHDQKIVQARSTDGVTWTDRQDTVKNTDFYVRPGMPGVRQLKDGTYFMVYEVCNLDEPLCSTYYRTSPDGWDYGDPFNLGTGIRTADGKYPRHTPTISVGPSGQIVFVAEMLVNADGSHAPGNGTTLLVNDDNGAGPWREIPAPVPVPNPNNEGCRNFSPALLAEADTVLQLASDNHEGFCKVYYARGPIPPVG
ncbi:MAG: sialidase family protein [Actinophytocola sp.]|uniref:sialidase family protein n=1 Tax=Actinophytocola sp. TaxID=1872138 RepID=UPI003D6A5476